MQTAIIEDSEYRHPAFLVNTKGHKSRPETVYFALLLRAQQQGTLRQEAEMLRVTLALAEAQVRRFHLLPLKRQHSVNLMIEKCDENLDEARRIASECRFTIVRIVR